MDDSRQVRCCGRAMTRIGVEQPGAEALRLHSCPSCGRHAWFAGDREVDRDAVLAALRVRREPAARPAARGRAPVPAADDGGEAQRRAELQRLLGGFTVHGSTS